MANTKKTASKRSKKEETKRVDPDFSIVLDDEGHFVLDLYDHGEYISGKITACDLLVVYVRIIIVDTKAEQYAFVSFPSRYKEGKKGKKSEYISQAFFIDSDIVNSMNEAVTNYVFND